MPRRIKEIFQIFVYPLLNSPMTKNASLPLQQHLTITLSNDYYLSLLSMKGDKKERRIKLDSEMKDYRICLLGHKKIKWRIRSASTIKLQTEEYWEHRRLL